MNLHHSPLCNIAGYNLCMYICFLRAEPVEFCHSVYIGKGKMLLHDRSGKVYSHVQIEHALVECGQKPFCKICNNSIIIMLAKIANRFSDS